MNAFWDLCAQHWSKDRNTWLKFNPRRKCLSAANFLRHFLSVDGPWDDLQRPSKRKNSILGQPRLGVSSKVSLVAREECLFEDLRSLKTHAWVPRRHRVHRSSLLGVGREVGTQAVQVSCKSWDFAHSSLSNHPVRVSAALETDATQGPSGSSAGARAACLGTLLSLGEAPEPAHWLPLSFP